jgi:hypothetical protein
MRQALWFGLAIVAALMVTAAPTSAQVQVIVKANIPFPFVVGGQTIPAGTYEVVQTASDLLELRPANGNGKALVYVTRLAQTEGTAIPGELIFDKVDGQNILSEVWYSGQDGYLIAATKGAHTHVRVKGSK